MSKPTIVVLISSCIGFIGILVGAFKEQIIGFFQKSKRNASMGSDSIDNGPVQHICKKYR